MPVRLVIELCSLVTRVHVYIHEHEHGNGEFHGVTGKMKDFADVLVARAGVS